MTCNMDSRQEGQKHASDNVATAPSRDELHPHKMAGDSLVPMAEREIPSMLTTTRTAAFHRSTL